MGFVYSPSNMDTFRKCPKRFEGQSITGEIKWKASKAKNRGTEVHNALERAVLEGIDKMPLVDGIDAAFVTQKVNDVRAAEKLGASILVEHAMCMRRDKTSAGWWDDDAYLRARADMLILPGNTGIPPLVVDFKTGKKWDEDAFQLRVETLLVHHLYGANRVGYSYWYVDTGDVCSGVVDYSGGYQDVADVLLLLDTMDKAIAASAFMPTRNKFCKWCDFFQTPKCSLR